MRKFTVILLLSCIGLVGCEPAVEKMGAVVAVPELTALEPKVSVVAGVNVPGEPLNCPVMLTSKSSFDERRGKQFLSFSLVKNPRFDIEKGDACQGELKNIWPDLNRFDEEIELHVPNLGHISGISRNLKFFPETERALKAYLDVMATEALLHESLDEIDQPTSRGRLDVVLAVGRFVERNDDAYFASVHAPVIEALLSKYNLKMGTYDTAKLTYCYHPYSICHPTSARELSWGTTLKLERVGAPFDWYCFQQPD